MPDSSSHRLNLQPLRRLLPWLAPGAFLGLFFFHPLARILGIGLDLTFISKSPYFLSRTFAVLRFTFYQAALSTLLTLLLGLPLAYLFARFDFPSKGLFRALTAIPFMLPTVVVAPRDSVYDKMISQVEQVKARGGPVLAVAHANDAVMHAKADHVLPIPEADELLMPILAVMPLQIFSYEMAVRRGADPRRAPAATGSTHR